MVNKKSSSKDCRGIRLKVRLLFKSHRTERLFYSDYSSLHFQVELAWWSFQSTTIDNSKTAWYHENLTQFGQGCQFFCENGKAVKKGYKVSNLYQGVLRKVGHLDLYTTD